MLKVKIDPLMDFVKQASKVDKISFCDAKLLKKTSSAANVDATRGKKCRNKRYELRSLAIKRFGI